MDPQQIKSIFSVWKTNNRITCFLIENISEDLWIKKVPGINRKSVRMIAGHIHNTRCMWIKTLGSKHGLTIPSGVNRYKVNPEQLLSALDESSRGMIDLIKFGFDQGGKLAGFPQDVFNFTTYIIAHEAHHRGQICLIARQTGKQLPENVTAGLWMWSKRAGELKILN